MAMAGIITLSINEYNRLLEAARNDDMIVECEVCGAWLDRDDPATAVLECFTGCWKAATHDSRYDGMCRSHRAPR